MDGSCTFRPFDFIKNCNRETRSREDPFAVAVMKNEEILGHIPCIYVFTGPIDIVDKTHQCLAELKTQTVKTKSDADDTDAKV